MSSPGSACFAQQVEGDGAVPGMIGRGSRPPAAEWLRGVRRRFQRVVRYGVGGRDGEAAIEVGEERRQEGGGGLERPDPAQAQLADETILQRLPEAFDAAFGLRGVGGDVANAEVLEDAAEVGRVLSALQFL